MVFSLIAFFACHWFSSSYFMFFATFISFLMPFIVWYASFRFRHFFRFSSYCHAILHAISISLCFICHCHFITLFRRLTPLFFAFFFFTFGWFSLLDFSLLRFSFRHFHFSIISLSVFAAASFDYFHFVFHFQYLLFSHFSLFYIFFAAFIFDYFSLPWLAFLASLSFSFIDTFFIIFASVLAFFRFSSVIFHFSSPPFYDTSSSLSFTLLRYFSFLRFRRSSLFIAIVTLFSPLPFQTFDFRLISFRLFR